MKARPLFTLRWFALGWVAGLVSGAAWLLWALRRKGNDIATRTKRYRGEDRARVTDEDRARMTAFVIAESRRLYQGEVTHGEES